MDHRTYNPLLIQKILQQSIQSDAPSKNSSQLSLNPFEMTIDIGDGRESKIQITRKDDPLVIARRFCFQHNLDVKIIQLLAKKIKSFIHSMYPNQNIEPNVTQHSSMKDSKFNRTLTENSLRDSNGMSVHQRLYNQSKKNQSVLNESEPIKMDTHKGLNNGVLIYERNVRLTEENRKKIEKRIEQLKQSKESELTFKPEINEISKLMVDKMREEEGMENFYERNKELQKQKIVNLKRQKELEEMVECTFQPKVNQKMNRYQLSRSTDRFNILYQDWNDRKMRNQNLKNQYSKKDLTFHPKINKLSEMIINGVTFDQRLKKYSCDKLLKEEQLKRCKNFEMTSDLDNTQLYKPRTGRPPQSRNLDKLPVGEYLYNHRHKKEQGLKSNPHFQPYKTSPNSSKLYETSKIQALQDIFNLLDSDSDKLISATKINISDLDPKVLKIFAPLLAEMEEVAVELDEEEFVESADKLFKTLTIYEKNLIMSIGKHKKTTEFSICQPSLNERSMQIANHIRSINKPGVSLYEFCQERRTKKEEKINQMREISHLLQMQECTFQPNIQKYKRV